MQPFLGNPTYTRAILQSHHISAHKKFGQNFLIDSGVLEDTVDAAGIGPDDFVLEIGPGIGTLTQYLASRARKVCAVEIDRSLIPVLEDTLSGWKNVNIVIGDILKTDIAEIADRENAGAPIKVVANLPYYITTPIILQLLESSAPIESITVMVQKEVAERMEAAPGSKSYGALTLAVGYYSKPEIIRDVAPSSFMPQPGVMSSVIHLAKYQTPPVDAEDPDYMFRLIRASFNQRRKKLTNGILNAPDLGVDREMSERALEAAGLDIGVRGEKLSLADFAKLSNCLLAEKNK